MIKLWLVDATLVIYQQHGFMITRHEQLQSTAIPYLCLNPI